MPSKKKTTKKKTVKTAARSGASMTTMSTPRAAKKSWRSMNVLGGIVIILLGITVVLLMITYFSVQPQM